VADHGALAVTEEDIDPIPLPPLLEHPRQHRYLSIDVIAIRTSRFPAHARCSRPTAEIQQFLDRLGVSSGFVFPSKRSPTGHIPADMLKL
jgi:hypothetical protein